MPTKQQYEQKVSDLNTEMEELDRRRMRTIDKIVHRRNAVQKIEILISKGYFEIALKRIELYRKRIDIIEWSVYRARIQIVEMMTEEM